MTLRQKAELLTGKDFWQTKDFEELGIPALFLSDGPHGLRKQAAAADHLGLNASIPATCFPTAAAMANSWNPVLGEEMGEALGEEAAAMNVNMLLGPGLNMKRNPRCGRNFEYFSEDPYLAGKMAAGYVRGIQKNGTSACVKHYACNNQELRRMTSDSVLDERTLREIYLTAFEIAVKEGQPYAVMSSYNQVNGVYANENEHLLKEILREDWGFDGTIVSDWAGCNDRAEGVKAGSDIEMPSCLYGIDDVVKAVEEGRLDEKYVDECVLRIFDLIERTTKEGKKGADGFDQEAHHAIAGKCAEESVVLLKNDGVLPVQAAKKVAVIGDFVKTPRYQGAGSSVVNPTKLDTVEGNLSSVGFEVVGVEQGFDRYGKKKPALLKKAVALAEKADIVLLFLGLDEVTEAEGLDRENISLPLNQQECYRALKATGKKVVVVLSAGSCVDTRFMADTDALVYACLTGQAGAKAVLDVIEGKVNPSGKLAETFSLAYEDAASASRFPGEQLTVEYREGLYIGYRYFDTAGVPVAYPFGHGLSYTSFAYENLEVTENGVSLTVKNTGERDGKEIVQLYVGKKDGEIFRPAKELKGFAKVELAAGESKKVEIPFDDKTFRYFNVATNAWEEEAGEYQLYLAASSQDVRLTGSIERKGTGAVNPYNKQDLPSYYSGQVASVSDEEFKTLIGREIPPAGYPFYKKNRMVIHENCTVDDLRYAKGWTGRLFSWAIRFAIGFMKAIGNKTMANTLVMGMKHQPVRGIAKFTSLSGRQLQGMITMFNGKFFKGAGMFLSKEKKAK